MLYMRLNTQSLARALPSIRSRAQNRHVRLTALEMLSVAFTKVMDVSAAGQSLLINVLARRA